MFIRFSLLNLLMCRVFQAFKTFEQTNPNSLKQNIMNNQIQTNSGNSILSENKVSLFQDPRLNNLSTKENFSAKIFPLILLSMIEKLFYRYDNKSLWTFHQNSVIDACIFSVIWIICKYT